LRSPDPAWPVHAEPIEGQDAICQAQIGILHSNPNSLTRVFPSAATRLVCPLSVEDGATAAFTIGGFHAEDIDHAGRTTKRARRPVYRSRAQYWFVVSLRFLVTYSSSVPSWVSSADEFASLRVYHYTLSASEVEIVLGLLPTFRQWDNHLFQVFCDVLGETGFVFKRIPSITCEEPGSIYRLLESHLKINDVVSN